MMLDKLPTRRYFITIFLIVLALFITFSLVIYHNYQIERKLYHATFYNYKTAHLSSQLMLDLVDMETGVRGYLLTRDRRFLQPYLTSVPRINAQIKQLYEYAKYDPYTQDKLDDWLHEIEKYNSLLLNQVRELSTGQSRNTTVMMEQQKQQMDHLRSDMEAYIAQRLKVHEAQREQAEKSTQNFIYILGIGTVLAVGSTLLAITIVLTLLSRSRKAEEQNQELEQRFITIMSGVNDGVYDFSLINEEIYYSPSYKAMLGYAVDEFPSVVESTWDNMHPDDVEHTRAVLDAFIKGERETYSNIFRMRHRMGHWVWVLSRGVGIKERGNKMVRIIGTHTDITEQKKREEELAALNTEMEAFTYITSHDLRAPLVNLKGFAKEMRHAVGRIAPIVESRKEAFTDEEQRALHEAIEVDITESLGFIEQAVVRMDALTTAVLDLSRIGRREYHVVNVDLNQIVKRCLDTMAYEINRKNITVNAQTLPEIHSDPLALEQVISNILDNAIKYLDDSRTGTIQISSKPYGSEIIISISDNGRGIAKEDKEKVFQLFRRARNSQNVRGMGMGMAYVQATVRKLHGAIWFTSAVGEGTTFFIRLPRNLQVTQSIAA